MKAILVIDVDDNADFENAIADITFRENEWRLVPRGIKCWHKGIKPKPLPHKKNKIKELPQYTKEYEAYCKGEVDGYNQCIDEILGEENEVYR